MAEQSVSLDVKDLHINLPVSEAIEFAPRCLYSIDIRPDIERSTLKLRHKLAVTNVCLKNNGICYYQKDGLAKGPSLAVTSTNIWMKTFEEKLSSEDEMSSGETKYENVSFVI